MHKNRLKKKKSIFVFVSPILLPLQLGQKLREMSLFLGWFIRNSSACFDKQTYVYERSSKATPLELRKLLFPLWKFLKAIWKFVHVLLLRLSHIIFFKSQISSKMRRNFACDSSVWTPSGNRVLGFKYQLDIKCQGWHLPLASWLLNCAPNLQLWPRKFLGKEFAKPAKIASVTYATCPAVISELSWGSN